MGYHIAMTLCTLLLPLIMVGFGAWMALSPPTDINPMFGYRTPMSEKSPAAWEFANRFIGRLWFPCGIAMTPPSLILMILLPNGTEDSVAAVAVTVMGVQCVILLATIVVTEIALHKNFDRKGNPKL